MCTHLHISFWGWLLGGAGADTTISAGRYNFTPLHYAAHEGHAEVVQLLLSFGADPAIADIDGNTPLDLAEDEQVQEALRPCRRVTAVEATPEGSAPGEVHFGASTVSSTNVNRADDDTNKCKICLEKPIETIMLPCGHQVCTRRQLSGC